MQYVAPGLYTSSRSASPLTSRHLQFGMSRTFRAELIVYCTVLYLSVLILFNLVFVRNVLRKVSYNISDMFMIQTYICTRLHLRSANDTYHPHTYVYKSFCAAAILLFQVKKNSTLTNVTYFSNIDPYRSGPRFAAV